MCDKTENFGTKLKKFTSDTIAFNRKYAFNILFSLTICYYILDVVIFWFLFSDKNLSHPIPNCVIILMILFLIPSMANFLYEMMNANSNKLRIINILFLFSLFIFLISLFSLVYYNCGVIINGYSKIQTHKGFDSLYLSFSTITTLGYGNILPAGHTGIICANIEAMLGVIFFGLYVGAIVGFMQKNPNFKA